VTVLGVVIDFGTMVMFRDPNAGAFVLIGMWAWLGAVLILISR
jgi:hypothetical protein